MLKHAPTQHNTTSTILRIQKTHICQQKHAMHKNTYNRHISNIITNKHETCKTSMLTAALTNKNIHISTKTQNYNLREFVVNSRHPSPRRVLGRCRAAVRGPDPRDPGDPLDPRMGSFLRLLGMKNNKNEKCHSRICNTPSVFATFVFQMSTLHDFTTFSQKHYNIIVFSYHFEICGSQKHYFFMTVPCFL